MADRVEGYDGSAVVVVAAAKNTLVMVPDVVVSGTFEEVRRP